MTTNLSAGAVLPCPWAHTEGMHYVTIEPDIAYRSGQYPFEQARCTCGATGPRAIGRLAAIERWSAALRAQPEAKHGKAE